MSDPGAPDRRQSDVADEFAIERRRGGRRSADSQASLEQNLARALEEANELGDKGEKGEKRADRRRPVLEDQFGQSADQLRSFRQLLTTVRWGTIAIAAGLAANRGLTVAILLAGSFIVLNAVIRTFRPIVYRPTDPEGWFGILLELTLHVGAVITTGYWNSPFFFCLAAAIVAAGLVRGFKVGCAVGAGAAVFIAGASVATKSDQLLDATLVGAGQLVLVGAIAGYGNRLFGEARAQAATALSRIGRLAEVNSLLAELHQVAQTLPVSLDLDETISSTASRVRALLRPDVIVVLVFEEATSTWRTAFAEGTRIPSRMDESELPHVFQQLTDVRATVLVENLPQSSNGPGLGFNSVCGLYAPLIARSQLVGMLAVEASTPETLGKRHLGLVDGLAEQVALSLDNARWFARLRTVGAEEERLRIARDLHDRVGQSLAYMAFELDRLAIQSETSPVTTELKQLRGDVRKVVTEVRETLYDLRTEVTDTSDLSTTLRQFGDRVRDRSNLNVTIDADVSARPPLLHERELWRIAAEAITNVERHAHATSITVNYKSNEAGVSLEIVDDGAGFVVGHAGRADSYGMVGMRERADAIGATLELDSAPGQGTTIRCTLNRRTLDR